MSSKKFKLFSPRKLCNFDVKLAFEKQQKEKKFSSFAADSAYKQKNIFLFVSRKRSVASCGSRVDEEFAGAKA